MSANARAGRREQTEDLRANGRLVGNGAVTDVQDSLIRAGWKASYANEISTAQAVEATVEVRPREIWLLEIDGPIAITVALHMHNAYAADGVRALRQRAKQHVAAIRDIAVSSARDLVWSEITSLVGGAAGVHRPLARSCPTCYSFPETCHYHCNHTRPRNSFHSIHQIRSHRSRHRQVGS